MLYLVAQNRPPPVGEGATLFSGKSYLCGGGGGAVCVPASTAAGAWDPDARQPDPHGPRGVPPPHPGRRREAHVLRRPARAARGARGPSCLRPIALHLFPLIIEFASSLCRKHRGRFSVGLTLPAEFGPKLQPPINPISTDITATPVQSDEKIKSGIIPTGMNTTTLLPPQTTTHPPSYHQIVVISIISTL